MTALLDIGKEIIKYGAPLLGFAVAGPTGASIASEVASMFGANTDGSDLIAKMASDPDAATKLAQIQARKQVDLQNISAMLLEAQYAHEDHQADDDVKDVEDARKMEETSKSIFPHVLSSLILFAFISALCVLLCRPIPSDNREMILGLGVALAYAFFMVCRFWLGGVLPVKEIEAIKGSK